MRIEKNKEPTKEGKDTKSTESSGKAKKRSEVIKKNAKAVDDKETNVEISSKAPAEKIPATPPSYKKVGAQGPSEEKEMKEAETLMSHVDGGKLSDSEKEMAVKRVGEILKKYTATTQ